MGWDRLERLRDNVRSQKLPSEALFRVRRTTAAIRTNGVCFPVGYPERGMGNLANYHWIAPFGEGSGAMPKVGNASVLPLEPFCARDDQSDILEWRSRA